MQKKIEQLINKGVVIPNPESLEIGAEVNLDHISGEGVQIHSGCRLFGRTTRIMAHARLGSEAPATVQDCQIGPQVNLKGGFFKASTFLEKASAGSGAQVREGCVFEEAASIAHTVGLKQTVLFPFVTLGSLINFCDCLMAGGTSRTNHSEVGSAYIHFNFTPNQDKATPSLVGEVPAGVMLDQHPIFLGGQGGLVGPSRIAYGTIAAAGTILRKDVRQPDSMIIEAGGSGGSVPYVPGRYRVVKRIVHNNILYIGNIFALNQWYRHVRSRLTSDRFPDFFARAVQEKLVLIQTERIQRLHQLAEKMALSIQNDPEIQENRSTSRRLAQQRELLDQKDALKDRLQHSASYSGERRLRDQFLDKLVKAHAQSAPSYVQTIQSLDQHTKQLGSTWLQGIVDRTLASALEILPSFK